MAKIEALYEAILNGDARAASVVAESALAEGRDALENVSDSMIAVWNS